MPSAGCVDAHSLGAHDPSVCCVLPTLRAARQPRLDRALALVDVFGPHVVATSIPRGYLSDKYHWARLSRRQVASCSETHLVSPESCRAIWAGLSTRISWGRSLTAVTASSAGAHQWSHPVTSGATSGSSSRSALSPRVGAIEFPRFEPLQSGRPLQMLRQRRWTAL